MTGIDIVILVVLAVSGIVSYLRGFFREAISLITWLAAILITLSYTSRFATLLPRDSIQSTAARATISAILLFAICMAVGWVARWLFRRIMAGNPLRFVDRLIGVFFGIARGIVIVALVVLAAHLAPSLQQERWWNESLLLPQFDKLARAIHEQLPQDVAQHFFFSPVSI